MSKAKSLVTIAELRSPDEHWRKEVDAMFDECLVLTNLLVGLKGENLTDGTVGVLAEMLEGTVMDIRCITNDLEFVRTRAT